MNRRTFLQASLAAAAGMASGVVPSRPDSSDASTSATLTGEGGAAGSRQFDHYFFPILAGFLCNARRTDPTYAVCDFPDGTMLKSCSTPSGRTYVSVARMLPALAAWVKGGREAAPVEVDGARPDLRQVLLSIYRHAFDPAHPNYWGAANARKADQRQVEASLVAHSLWLLGDDFLRELTPGERTNIQAWLASCTVVPEHKHNHAWFSGLNQMVRLDLAERWPEFSGDADWMNADLAALDAMAIPGGKGWYNDYPGYIVHDWYNFWTYASHFLLWNEVAGERYPEWRRRYLDRLREFLPDSAHFFGANGSPVLFGRSLIYRWAAITPLVLAYLQGEWPHSPGLLRSLVRRNLEFFWEAGAFDAERGKLRESFAPHSSPAIRERYIDNGHPYWGMQAFALFRLPESDPFWSAPEEPLPVERADFQLRYPALGMQLLGTKESGQVRWFQSRNLHKPAYRDKYLKFSYSSHFPFNAVDDPDRCPWDQTLVFRDSASGRSAGRSVIHRGELLPDGSLLTEWTATLGDCPFEVVSRIRPFGEFEERTHVIRAIPAAVAAGIEALEGSYSLGLSESEEPETQSGPGWALLRHPASGAVVLSIALSGFEEPRVAREFDGAKGPTNVLFPRIALHTLRAAVAEEQMTLVSLHYASPKPKRLDEILQLAGVATGELPA